MTPKKLTGLRPQAYEHPSDAMALNALTHTAGLDTLVRKLNEWGFERLLRVQLTGSYLRATADSFPDLHDLLKTACEALDSPLMPDLYVGGQGELNAFTAGVDKPLILLSTGAVELLSREELLFVIGHEVGHVKSGHVLYYQIAEFLPIIAEMVGSATFGIGELLSAGMQVALLRWKRMSEFTADRAGLLACQDADVSLRTMMKLAGLPHRYYGAINTEDFMRQAREFQALDQDKLTLLAKWLSTMGETHPWTVMRAQGLLQWIESSDYEQVLKNPFGPPPRLPQGVTGFCDQCGWPRRGPEVFCPGCGRSFAPPVQPPSLPAQA
jgi:Zn-dependent protease with chaperone function